MRPLDRPQLRRLGVGAALLALLPTAVAAQVFEESQSVVAVEVAVQVLRDGQPVRGLARDDFEIYEGKRRQELTGFEVVDLQTLDPAAGLRVATIPAAGRRHLLLLFDLAFAGPRQIANAQVAAHELVASRLHPTDLVAVAVYTSRHGARLILGFTSDRAQVDLALSTLGAPQVVDRSIDSLALTLGQMKTRAEADMRTARTRAGEEVYNQMIEWTKDDIVAADAASTEVEGARAAALTRSFADLGRLMQGVQGRKFVLYFSEGFDADLLLGNQEAQVESRTELERQTPVLEHVDSQRLHGSSRLLGDLERMLEEFRRADCVIEAIDVGGVRAARALDPAGDRKPGGALGTAGPAGEDSLFVMAERTGGNLYRNFNDLGEALARSLARSSVTYVLSFQPRDPPLDGSFRPIEVRLAKPQRGVVLRHRAGYFAPGAGPRPKVQERLELADLVLGGRAGGAIASALLAAPLRGEGGRARVPVVVEVPGEELLRGHDVGLLTAEVYAYAFDPAGTIADQFAQSVGLNLLKVERQLRSTGLKVYGELDLPAGDYDLRVLVRNAQTGRHGLSTIRVAVPDFAGPAPMVTAPFFLDPADWVVARAASPDPHPLALDGEPFVPAASVEVGRAATARFCVLAYNLAASGSGPRLEARVVDQAGRERETGPLALEDQGESAAPGARQYVATFSPQGLERGAYTLELRLRDAGGVELATQSLSIRVN